jgi:hypothetical protein
MPDEHTPTSGVLLLSHPESTVYCNVDWTKTLHFEGQIPTLATYKLRDLRAGEVQPVRFIIQDTVGNILTKKIPEIVKGRHDGWDYSIVESNNGIPKVIRRVKYALEHSEEFADLLKSEDAESTDEEVEYPEQIIYLNFDHDFRLMGGDIMAGGEKIYSVENSFDEEGRLVSSYEQTANREKRKKKERLVRSYNPDADKKKSIVDEEYTLYNYEKAGSLIYIRQGRYKRVCFRDMDIYILDADSVALGMSDNQQMLLSPVVRPGNIYKYANYSNDEHDLHFSLDDYAAYRFIQHKKGKRIVLSLTSGGEDRIPAFSSITLPAYLTPEQIEEAKIKSFHDLEEIPVNLQTHSMYLDEVIQELHKRKTLEEHFDFFMKVVSGEVITSNINPLNIQQLIRARLELSKEARIALLASQIPTYITQVYLGYMNADQARDMAGKLDELLDITPEDRNAFVQSLLYSRRETSEDEKVGLKLLIVHNNLQDILNSNKDFFRRLLER